MANIHRPVDQLKGNLTKEQIQNRKDTENRLKPDTDCIEPVKELNLSAKDKKVFYAIREILESIKVLTNADSYLLSLTAKAIVEVGTLTTDYRIESKAKNYKDMKLLKGMIKSEENDLKKYFSELCLTPQARAKMGAMVVQTKENEQDPFNQFLKKREQKKQERVNEDE